VVPVPDSSTVAAIGYAEESGIPYTVGLIRSHYIGRTFIEPEQKIRDFGAKIKYNVIPAAVRGKRIVLMIRKAGAKEIHLRISAPPTRFPCYYGIDIPTRQELIAATHSVEEIVRYLRVDSLGYMSLDSAHSAMRASFGADRRWCDACFSGRYPVDFEDGQEGNQKDLFPEYLVEEVY
jgi:amidophosphoribosyltransferase